jgi:hypothetical protein
MSEIYAPGSIAGPQGPAGPTGSATAVSALAGAIMPSFVGRNLFDSSLITPATQVNAADGSLTIGGQPTDATALIYCAGATSMITNMRANGNNLGAGICFYDANGAFLSSASIAVTASVAFALPGTQTYVRFGYVPSWMPAGFAQSSGMIAAAITGTATLPASYQPCGLDTVADVNAKDAVVAANAQAALTAAVTGIGTVLGTFAHTMLPRPDGAGRNALDVHRALANTLISSTGVQTPAAGWTSAMVFAPGATQFITNLPIRGTVGSVSGTSLGVCTYDAFGNFLAEISSEWADGLILPNNVYALPGNQTYVGFTYNTGNYGWGPESNGQYYSPSDAAAMFLVGNAATPCPTSLPEGAPACGSWLANVKTATQLGAANDGSADCTALLNAFLATASSTNPIKLILDGTFLTTGLVISPSGYTTIEGIGPGSGLVMSSGANSIVIGSQGPGNYNVTPPARTATNIALRNFTVIAAGAAGVAMMLACCSNVLVENVQFPHAGSGMDFMLTITNANQVFVRGCTFASMGYGHDGVHVDGLCEDITVSDCAFATGDDAIALNAPEGYGGDISRVTVTNCRFNNSLTVMRIYTSLDAAAMPSNNVHKVRDVVVSNCTGVVTGVCFNLGITNGGLSATTGADQIQDLTVSNCALSAPQGLALLLTPIGSLVFRGIGFIPTSPSALVNALFSGVGELVLDNVRVIRNADGNAAPGAFVYLYSGVALDRVSLLNCRVVDEEGSSYAPVPCLLDVNGAVAALRLEAIDMTHIAALASAAGWSGVTALRGGGLLGSGVPVPDSVMDNNALYLSSNAGGAPSIKVGGTTKRLTLA